VPEPEKSSQKCSNIHCKTLIFPQNFFTKKKTEKKQKKERKIRKKNQKKTEKKKEKKYLENKFLRGSRLDSSVEFGNDCVIIIVEGLNELNVNVYRRGSILDCDGHRVVVKRPDRSR
jgi:DNA gyrase/topoisomerase IV subunit B